MFWFWCNVVRDLLMLLMDGVWLVLCAYLITRKPWRVLATVFVAGQMVAFYLLLADVGWHHYAPKGLLVAVVTWHYFGPILLLLLGIQRVWIWLRGRSKGRRQDRAVATSTDPEAMSRRDFFGVCTALTPPLFNLGLTGVASAQLTQFRVRRFTLSVPTLPRALDGLTLAHLSDMHVGPWTNGRVLRKMVETTNALRADLVLLTGDLIDYELADLSEGIALIKAMEGRYGLWLIEGNHDLLQDGGEFERRVRAAGVPFLVDESVVTDVRGYPVQVLGLSWTGAASFEHPDSADNGTRQNLPGALQIGQLMKRPRPGAFPILLAHHPHVFDAAVEAALPLTLAGHTHGGQWMLGRRLGVAPILFRYWSGLYTRGHSQLIVSNGVGNVLPLRINAPAEIVYITLRCV